MCHCKLWEKRPTKNLEESIIGFFVESVDQVLEFYITTSNVLISSRTVKESNDLFLIFQFKKQLTELSKHSFCGFFCAQHIEVFRESSRASTRQPNYA